MLFHAACTDESGGDYALELGLLTKLHVRWTLRLRFLSNPANFKRSRVKTYWIRKKNIWLAEFQTILVQLFNSFLFFRKGQHRFKQVSQFFFYQWKASSTARHLYTYCKSSPWNAFVAAAIASKGTMYPMRLARNRMESNRFTCSFEKNTSYLSLPLCWYLPISRKVFFSYWALCPHVKIHEFALFSDKMEAKSWIL